MASQRSGHVLSYCEGMVYGLRIRAKMASKSDAYMEGAYYGLRESALDNPTSKERLEPELNCAKKEHGADPDFKSGRRWGRAEWEKAKQAES